MNKDNIWHYSYISLKITHTYMLTYTSYVSELNCKWNFFFFFFGRNTSTLLAAHNTNHSRVYYCLVYVHIKHIVINDVSCFVNTLLASITVNTFSKLFLEIQLYYYVNHDTGNRCH